MKKALTEKEQQRIDKAEYIETRLAEELDDVSFSFGLMQGRDALISEIEEKTDEKTLQEWEDEINKILSHPDTHYCGGGLYNKVMVET